MREAPEFPAKLRFLFEPHRYKVLRGGRGSAKSWGAARALLILGRKRKLRIVCAREIQKSIKESVHQLLVDQIELLGLSAFYEVLENEIRGRNGTTFNFTGLQQHTVHSIKSLEGCDILWVEEAQAVSRRSWVIVIPTIRKDGSEIWVTFNPELDTDETYDRFVINPPPDAVSIEMNYHENPWFNDILEAERRHAKATMPRAEYENVWLGKTKPAVDGAIYAEEIAAMYEEKRICDLPHDPMLRTHVVLDLGWNDAMFATMVQRHISQLRVIDCIETSHTLLEDLNLEIKGKHADVPADLARLRSRYNWGKLWVPHDGHHGNYFTGLTAAQTFKKLGWAIGRIPNISVEDGIRRGRSALGRTYIDKTKGRPLINSLRRYKRDLIGKTEEPGRPTHDAASHGGDNWRYTAIVAPSMTNDGDAVVIPRNRIDTYPVDDTMGM